MRFARTSDQYFALAIETLVELLLDIVSESVIQ